MTAVSAIYARKQIEHAANLTDKIPLYDIINLTPQEASDPTRMVAISSYFELLETIAHSEFPDLQFHMKTSQSMRCDEFGLFGLAFKSAPTLRQGFQRIWRYTQLHNRVSDFSAEQIGNQFGWTMLAPQINRMGAYLSVEAALATTLTLCRETTDKTLRPRHVQFTHDREGSVDALVEHFGRLPEFGAASNAMFFDVEQVDTPCTIGDAGIWNYMIGHLDQALENVADQDLPFETQVIEEIAKLLSGGVPQLSDVSKTLGLGARTVQRRLQERGKTFQIMVDEARKQLAQQLVSASSYSLAEIAFLTGFSEQSAFSRAFKRWSGQSPRAYRLELQRRNPGQPQL